MAKKVPPFHLRTIPAAIYDELWVKNPTTNEYEEIDGGVANLTPPSWNDITDKPNTFAPTIGDTHDTAMAGDTSIPSGRALVPSGGSNGQILRIVSSIPTWSTEVTNSPMTAEQATEGTSNVSHTISPTVLSDAIEERVNVTNTQIDLVQTEIVTMQTEIVTMQTEITTLQDLVATLTARIVALETA